MISKFEICCFRGVFEAFRHFVYFLVFLHILPIFDPILIFVKCLAIFDKFPAFFVF